MGIKAETGECLGTFLLEFGLCSSRLGLVAIPVDFLGYGVSLQPMRLWVAIWGCFK